MSHSFTGLTLPGTPVNRFLHVGIGDGEPFADPAMLSTPTTSLGPPQRILGMTFSAASPTASRLSGQTLSRVSWGVCHQAPGVGPGP